MTHTDLLARPKLPNKPRTPLVWRNLGNSLLSLRSIPYLYLCVTLPAVLVLSFLVPPMQLIDESRHFVRACQIAQGNLLPQIDKATGRGGGVLPQAVADFVRRWMNTDTLRSEEITSRTVGQRIHALDKASYSEAPIEKRKFVEFPSAGVYPPALYIPQSVGIRFARLFTDKVYVWLYSARVFNSLSAILLIFVALRVAPQHEFLLMLPAIVPISLSQFASVSSDASIIGLTILFIALCIRFTNEDDRLIRIGLIVSLLFLVLGKPVHLPLAFLLLMSYKRLGWRRAISFFVLAVGIAGVSYITWSYLVRPFIAMAGEGHGQDPPAQVHFVVAHPISLMKVVAVTLKKDGFQLSKQLIGVLGWEVLSLPAWFYVMALGVAALVLFIIIRHRKQVAMANLILGCCAAVALFASVLLAAYILWNPPASPTIIRLQGRYFLPAMAVIAVLAPPFFSLRRSSRIALAASTISFLLLSAYFTVRTLNHYYFPQCELLGRNIYDTLDRKPDHSCPASFESVHDSWLEWIITGKTVRPNDSKVIAVADDGTILGESDPALTGADLPYWLLPGSSRSRWRLHVWYLNRFDHLQLWLVRGNSACSFGPTLQFTPITMPDA
jgi:uncharacterized membrane protein